MKILLLALFSVFATQSFANLSSAPEKLLSCIPLGVHTGKNLNGSTCSVTVSEVNFPKRDLLVLIVSDNTIITKLIEEDSNARYVQGQRRFTQTDTINIGSDSTNYVQRSLSTNMVDETKQFVVLEYNVILNRDTNSQSAECIINL